MNTHDIPSFQPDSVETKLLEHAKQLIRENIELFVDFTEECLERHRERNLNHTIFLGRDCRVFYRLARHIANEYGIEPKKIKLLDLSRDYAVESGSFNTEEARGLLATLGIRPDELAHSAIIDTGYQGSIMQKIRALTGQPNNESNDMLLWSDNPAIERFTPKTSIAEQKFLEIVLDFEKLMKERVHPIRALKTDARGRVFPKYEVNQDDAELSSQIHRYFIEQANIYRASRPRANQE